MRMALANAGISDLHKLCILQFLDRARAAIAHARTQTANVLHHHFRQRAFVWNTPFDTFRHQFFNIVFHILEVAIFGALLHRTQRTHTAIHLEFPTFVDDRLARRFFNTGKQATCHDGACPGGNGFDNIARVANAAVANDRHARTFDALRRLHNSCQLRYANARNHTGGANTTRTNPDFHAIDASFHKCLRTASGSNITADHLQIREFFLDFPNAVQNAHRVPVRRIHANDVHTNFHQRLNPIKHIARDTNRPTDHQATKGIFAGIRIILHLHNILVGDQSDQLSILIDYRQFFNFMPLQNILRLLKRRTRRRGYQVFTGHQIGNRPIVARLKTQVAIRQNADQLVFFIHNGNPANLKLLHQLQCIAYAGIHFQRHRIDDHAAFRALHVTNLLRLPLDGHVFMDNANAALARDCNRQPTIGHRIHRRRYNRNIQPYFSCEQRSGIHFTGQDF